MKKFACIFLSLLSLMTPSASFGVTYANKEEMLTHLNVVKQIFQSSYAPTDWKKAHFQWSIDNEIQRAIKEVESKPSMPLKEYRKILKRIVFSARDYHTSISFLSTEGAYLPIKVKGVGEKYFISDIDRTHLTKSKYPFEIGDELVTFGGKPTHTVVKDLLAKESHNANEATDKSLSELHLTLRLASMGFDVPSGNITLSVKSQTTKATKPYTIKWIYFPEKIKCADPSYATSANNHQLHLNMLSQERLLKSHQLPTGRLMQNASFKSAFKGSSDQQLSFDLDHRNGFLPNLGEPTWSTSVTNPFRAYIFKHFDGRSIGFIRIPSYYSGYEESLEKVAKEYFKLISHLQKNTDALIIDETNNSGGSVLFSFALLSGLSDKPLDLTRERVRITQFEVASALEDLELIEVFGDEVIIEAFDNIHGFKIDKDFVTGMKDYAKFVINQWNQGKRFSDHTYFFGLKKLKPHQSSRYTKPILMLVNELSVSCGDLVPVILQENKRATIFGADTCGAGGAVEVLSYKNPFGVEGISFTASMGYKKDGTPIENHGSKPNIPYAITERDLTENMADYIQAVYNAIDKVLGK